MFLEHLLSHLFPVDDNLLPFHLCSRESFLKREKILLLLEIRFRELQILVMMTFRDINFHGKKAFLMLIYF